MREYSTTQHFPKFFNNQSLGDLLVSSVVGQLSQEPKVTTEDVSNSLSNTPSRMSTTTSKIPLRHARERAHLLDHTQNANLVLQKNKDKDDDIAEADFRAYLFSILKKNDLLTPEEDTIELDGDKKDLVDIDILGEKRDSNPLDHIKIKGSTEMVAVIMLIKHQSTFREEVRAQPADNANRHRPKKRR